MRRGLGIDHRRQRRRVRSDHCVLAEPALQPEPRHAEVRVLIGELEVARVVGGFGNSPRHAKLGAIVHLAAHHQPIGLLEQAAGRRAHHQRRHQVLEHRARPRDQRRAAIDRRHRASQPEPVPRRNFSFRDRDETRQPRLGSEQIVTVGIEAPVSYAVTDRQQLARRIEQEAELHRVEHFARGRGEFRQPPLERFGRVARARKRILIERRVRGSPGHYICPPDRPASASTRPRPALAAARCPRLQQFDVALMTADARLQRFRPCEHVGHGGVGALQRQRARDVGD